MFGGLVLRRALAYARSDRGFFSLLVAGAIVRIALAFLTSNSYDLWFFGSVAIAAKAHRPLYADTTFSYPPLWGYVFEDAGKLLGLLHVPVLVRVGELAPFAIPGLTKIELTTPLAAFFLKLPALLVDAALTFTLYRMTLRVGAGTSAARTVALGLWLNPLALLTAPVQANWDAIVPLTILVAIATALEERWIFAGAVAAIGVWAKLTPLFFAFFVPALVWYPVPRTLRAAARRVGNIALGACLASGVILAPVIVHGELPTMLASVFARTGTFQIGGANLLSFTQLNEGVGVREMIASARVGYGRFSLLLMVFFSLCPAIVLLRRAARDFTDYCTAVVAVLCAICIASPFVQPTYVLWVVPGTTFLAATYDRRWWWPTAVLTGFGSLFFVTVRAPQALVEPACVFFRLCNAASFGAQSVAYNAALGFRFNTFQITANVFAGEIVGVAMLATYLLAIRTLVTRVAGERAPVVARATAARRALPYALACGLIALCAGTLSPLPVTPHLDIRGHGDRAAIGAIGFASDVYACSVPASSPRLSEVYAYFDSRYPALRGVNATFANGFGAHFSDALQRKNIALPFRIVDANRLRSLLEEPPRGRALLVLGGALPETVRSQNVDLLKPWLLAGGTVFWAGGPFDLVWSHRTTAHDAPAFGGPDPGMWPTLYSTRGDTVFAREQNVFFPPVTYGRRIDPRTHVLGVEFARTTFPLNSGPLLRAGGHIIGRLDDHYNSSVSTLPIGRGTAIFFADTFDDEIVAADTITQLLLCNAWSPRAHALTYNGYLPDGGQPMTISLPRDTAYVDAFGNVDGLGPYASYRPR
jgi:hypothetical protein